MRDPVVQLLFIRILFRFGFGNALCNDLFEALSVASVLAVFALSTSTGKEIRAKGAAHDLIELLDSKLVSVHLLDLALSLADSSGTAQSRGVTFDTD
jgi:hypothetical protein